MFEGTGQLELRDLSAPALDVYTRQSLAKAGVRPPGLRGSDVGLQAFGAATGSAVFLHTGWRSGGSWIWSRLRASGRVHGYYEPLHEQAARFSRRDVSSVGPRSWASNHSETAPYFEEFRDLIPPGGRGVALYQRRFAFDDFFRAPDGPVDIELEAYLASLLAGPCAAAKLPVLKFCRSLGRVGWLEQMFPRALHAVVLRDPVAQFMSGQRLLREKRNRYFALAPVLVLARNAHHPAVRQAASTLGVRLPPLFSDDLDYAVETCWRHLRRQDTDEQYRGFLAFWTLCAIFALDSNALVIDLDALRGNAMHRHDIERVLGEHVGERIDLAPRQAQPDFEPATGFAAAHAAASGLVRAHGAHLAEDRLAVILAKLKTPLSDMQVYRDAWPGIAPPAPSSRPPRLAIWADVRMARAMQPLRRLHGAMVWRQK